MKNLKKILLQHPEYLLIATIIFFWGSSATIFNPLAIGLLSLLILQIIFKNRIAGIILSVVFILLSLFMLFALMSESGEFSKFDATVAKLIFVGLLYIISTIVFSGLMIYKSFQKPDNKEILQQPT